MIDAGEIDVSFVPRRATTVTAVELDGEAVLYSDVTGAVVVLDRIATVVWNCLDGSSDVEAICTDLADAFAVEVASVRADVVAAVQDFGRQGLLDGVAYDPALVPDQGSDQGPSEPGHPGDRDG